MSAKVITPNLIMFTRDFLFMTVNCYFVREEDGFTLIDTGIPGSAPSLLKVAGHQAQPILRIVITHAHFDHVSSLKALKSALPKAEILVNRQELERQDSSTFMGLPVHGLCEGDRIGSLEVYDVPGHTPGSMVLFDVRDQTLIAGDTFQTQGEVAVAGVRVKTFPFPAMGTWNKIMAAESARKLLALEPKRLATGHGPILENPLKAMEAAILKAERLHGG